MGTTTSKAPRERLLSAANKLFYGVGIHTVGIDRLLEEAGVAKASLYSAFGSKDELVRAYLVQRKEEREERIRKALARHASPRARILAIFEAQAAHIASAGFRGCAFVRASADGPLDKASKAVCDDARAWLRGVFEDLAQSVGGPDPKRLASQLIVLYDGVAVAAQMDRNAAASEGARAVAAMLIDHAQGHIPAGGRR